MTGDKSSNQCPKFFSRKYIFPIFFVFLAGMLTLAGFNYTLAYTNKMDFCTSCHSMQVNLAEYKETIHYKNAAGIRASCSDCHVPKAFLPKLKAKILAYKDVLNELLGTIDNKEKYQAHRWEMASRVWAKMKATDSRECRSCHNFNYMDFNEQDSLAGKKHLRARLNGKTCIDCHRGIAHEEPDEPDDEDSES